MKKIIAMMLAISITGSAFAQYDRMSVAVPNSITERLFNYPAPLKLPIRFDFLLSKANKMVLELDNIEQFYKLPDPDSIIKIVWKALQPFRDSLAKPLVNRRVDYVFSYVDEKIRIIEYPQRADIYRIKDNDVTQLKVEQDTLRIKFFPSMPEVVYSRRMKEKIQIARPYFIMLLLNNINDVSSFSADELGKGIALLKNDLDKNKKVSGNKSYTRSYALYDIAKNKRIVPFKKERIAFGRQNTVVPFIPVGLQYVRGAWVPSTGVGIEWAAINGNATRYLRLYWEPLFDFKRDAGNKLITHMNSFMAFKLTNTTKDPVTRNLIFANNFSIGYLVSRQGDLFEKNTIKFSLPGIQVKNVLLEPEFIFNKFFKNFSPSLKLSLYFE